MNDQSQPADETKGRVGEVARLFARLGAVAFGGPAAHIAMMEDEVVTRRRWMSRQHFLDLVGATNLVPGPNSTEMTMHVGLERAGWRGLLAAGACFVLPAATLTALFAWFYVTWGTLPEVAPLLAGIRPVVIAVIMAALLKLARTAVRSTRLAILGALVLAALVVWDVPELWALLVGGLVGGLWLALTRRTEPATRTASADESDTAENDTAENDTAEDDTAEDDAAEDDTDDRRLGGLPLVAVSAAGAAGAGGAAGATAVHAVSLVQLGLFFLKVGAVLYGSGYVLVAFLEGDLVERWGWLTEAQLLDALAVGQLTPGPVLTTATFIGFLLHGPEGAAVATLAIFLPSFVFVALLNPIVPRLRKNPWTAGFLDAVNVAAVALMAAVTADLVRVTLVDWPSWALTAAAAVALVRFRVHAAWLVLGGALAGLVLW